MPWALMDPFYFSKGKKAKGERVKAILAVGFLSLLGSAERFGVVSCCGKPSPGAPSQGPSADLTHPCVKIQQNGNIQLGFSPGMEGGKKGF